MKERISVFGVGRLGLSFSLLVNSKGYEVTGCDVNEKYIDSLNDKTFVSKEPGVTELLHKSSMGFTTDAKKAFDYADLIFVFVSTPSKGGGNYDHKYIEQIISKIESNGVKNKTLIIGCTVMPGYCQSIQKTLSVMGIQVIYNPEFIAQGSIIDGLKKADLVLIGGEIVPASLYQIYRGIMDKEPVFKTLSLTGAEIAKISINCFLTLKVSFANMVGEIVINSNEEKNMDSILDAIGGDSRIGKKFLGYGFPAGGVCLPRDQKALNYHANSVGINTKFTHAIDIENERHSEYLVEYYKKKNPDKNIPFIFSSLAYKAGTDILTNSFQLKLCIDLLRSGYRVDVPTSIKDIEMSEEFKDHCYKEMVTFGKNPDGCKVN